VVPAWTEEARLSTAEADQVVEACHPAASPFLVQWFELEVAREVSGLFLAAGVLLAAEPSSVQGSRTCG